MLSSIPKTLIPVVSLHLKARFIQGSLPFVCLTASAEARTMSSGSNQRVFQLRIDPLTGNSEWIVIEESEDGEGVDIFKNHQQSALATTSYLDMLNDTHRNRTFREAIDKAIQKPCHVLDIG